MVKTLINKAKNNHLIYKHKKIVKYGITGVIGTTIDFVTLVILVEIFGWQVLLANTTSFLLAVINNFILHKNWTFRNKDKRHVGQFLKFFTISTTGLLLNLLLMWWLLQFGMWYIIAKIMIIGMLGILSFLANNFWTFKKKEI